jgi:hypothetical protein
VVARPGTTRTTLAGGRFFVSVNLTWKAKDVVGLPDPGAAAPAVNVDLGDWFAQLAAATGDAIRKSAPRLEASANTRLSPRTEPVLSRE